MRLHKTNKRLNKALNLRLHKTNKRFNKALNMRLHKTNKRLNKALNKRLHKTNKRLNKALNMRLHKTNKRLLFHSDVLGCLFHSYVLGCLFHSDFFSRMLVSVESVIQCMFCFFCSNWAVACVCLCVCVSVSVCVAWTALVYPPTPACLIMICVFFVFFFSLSHFSEKWYVIHGGKCSMNIFCFLKKKWQRWQQCTCEVGPASWSRWVKLL